VIAELAPMPMLIATLKPYFLVDVRLLTWLFSSVLVFSMSAYA